MVVLGSKMFFGISDEKDKDGNIIVKCSCKGIQHKNNSRILNFEEYKRVLDSGNSNTCTNKGFRFINKEIVTYEVNKIGLSNVYVKGVVMKDGWHIRPLDI